MKDSSDNSVCFEIEMVPTLLKTRGTHQAYPTLEEVETSNPGSTRGNCVLAILRKESPATSSRIIELASTDEFKTICGDCKSGIEVYETAIRLYRTGLVSRKPGPGGFLWTLAESAPSHQ
jgi:hypothetical protein